MTVPQHRGLRGRKVTGKQANGLSASSLHATGRHVVIADVLHGLVHVLCRRFETLGTHKVVVLFFGCGDEKEFVSQCSNARKARKTRKSGKWKGKSERENEKREWQNVRAWRPSSQDPAPLALVCSVLVLPGRYCPQPPAAMPVHMHRNYRQRSKTAIIKKGDVKRMQKRGR